MNFASDYVLANEDDDCEEIDVTVNILKIHNIIIAGWFCVITIIELCFQISISLYEF
jgi:hypothetical protein